MCFSGVALVFIFSWLLMIAVVALFVSGGATYTEVCRPLLQPDSSSSVVRVSTTCSPDSVEFLGPVSALGKRDLIVN